jgi:hypothetical protein
LNLGVIIGMIAVVIIIALAAGVIIIRSRRRPMRPPAPEPPTPQPQISEPKKEDEKVEPTHKQKEEEFVEPDRPEPEWDDDGAEWEEDEGPVDLSKLERVTKNCPHCSAAISVEPSFDDKVSLACTKCGAKGRIPNPYKKDIERMKEEAEEQPPPPPPSESKEDLDLWEF